MKIRLLFILFTLFASSTGMIQATDTHNSQSRSFFAKPGVWFSATLASLTGVAYNIFPALDAWRKYVEWNTTPVPDLAIDKKYEKVAFYLSRHIKFRNRTTIAIACFCSSFLGFCFSLQSPNRQKTPPQKPKRLVTD